MVKKDDKTRIGLNQTGIGEAEGVRTIHLEAGKARLTLKLFFHYHSWSS